METRLITILDDKGHSIYTTSPDLSVFECAKQMNDLKVGALLVMQNKKLVGIVSERDITRKLIGCNCDISKYCVNDIMSKDVLTVSPTMSVTEAMRLITDKRIRHLPVIDNGTVIGMVSIGDLTRWVMLAQEGVISNLTKYIQGEH